MSFSCPSGSRPSRWPTREQAVVDQIQRGGASYAPCHAKSTSRPRNISSGPYAREEDDLDGKIADYAEAIRLNPGYTRPSTTAASARFDKGDLEGAIADYDEAIRLDPEYAPAFHNRGIARLVKGDLDGAIADFDEAIRLDPEYAPHVQQPGHCPP